MYLLVLIVRFMTFSGYPLRMNKVVIVLTLRSMVNLSDETRMARWISKLTVPGRGWGLVPPP